MRVESASPPSQVAEVLALLAAEMAQVDAVIAQRLSSDVALIDQIAHYIVHAGGKRMRPSCRPRRAFLWILFSPHTQPHDARNAKSPRVYPEPRRQGNGQLEWSSN